MATAVLTEQCHYRARSVSPAAVAQRLGHPILNIRVAGSNPAQFTYYFFFVLHAHTQPQFERNSVIIELAQCHQPQWLNG